jgi:hypothetical protein
MPHEIHVSERRSFRGCRRRWNWAYREGYVPETPIKALEFGIAYHEAMEVFYDPETWATTTPEEKVANAVKAFVTECDKQRAKYLITQKVRELPDEVAIDYDERVLLGVGMLTYHGTYVHPKLDNWFKPIAVEIPFEVPIEDPDNPGRSLRCTNSPYCGQSHSNDPNDADSCVVYAGRVDMLVEDTRYGGYFIWDHKTASQLASDDGFLQLDDQVGSYAWALRTILGLDIRGFIYAETRKDFPREPKKLKRLMGGRSFSTAQNQPTSIEVFEPFIKQHDKLAYESGVYDEYLQYLNGAEATQFSQRFVIIKSETELESIGANISLESADMVESQTRIYPSVGRYTCSTCAFRQPCLSEFMSEDTKLLLETQYIKTDRRYWMDQPRSSEKAGK